MIATSLRSPSQRRRITRVNKKQSGIEPRVLLQALDDPMLALAAAVTLQAFAECSTSSEAHELLNSDWLETFADAIDSEPDRLRSWFKIPDVAPAADPVAAPKQPRDRPRRYRKTTIDERDLSFFCERVPLIGHALSTWKRTMFPSGRRISYKLWRNKLLQPLCNAGLIINLNNGHGGRLVTADVDTLKRALGLAVDPEPTLSAEMPPQLTGSNSSL